MTDSSTPPQDAGILSEPGSVGLSRHGDECLSPNNSAATGPGTSAGPRLPGIWGGLVDLVEALRQAPGTLPPELAERIFALPEAVESELDKQEAMRDVVIVAAKLSHEQLTTATIQPATLSQLTAALLNLKEVLQ